MGRRNGLSGLREDDDDDDIWRPKRLRSADNQCAGIRFGLLNVLSVAERSLALSDVTTTRRLVVFALTETWHQTSDDLPLQRSAPPGYSVVAAARSEARSSTSTFWTSSSHVQMVNHPAAPSIHPTSSLTIPYSSVSSHPSRLPFDG